MFENRRGIVYVALLIAESSWLYAAAGVPCLALGFDGPPFPWATVAALLAVGMATTWVLGGVRGDPVRLAIAQGLTGLLAVYLALATQRLDGVGGFDLLWVERVFRGELDGPGILGLTLALLLAIFLWLRAGKLMYGRSLPDRIQRTFRIGMAAVSAALITELASGTDIGARLVLFPFFGASLTGMAASRLADPARRERTRAWVRIVGGSVGAILLAGLALGVLSGAYGGGALRLLSRGWSAFADGLMWVLRYPFQAVFAVIEAIGRWLMGLFDGPPQERELTDFGGLMPELGEQAEKAVGTDWFDTVMNVIRYPLAVILVVIVFLVLVRAYRRLRRPREPKEASNRESIKGDADVGSDLLRLFGHLLPEWMRRGQGAAAWRYPRGEPGVTQVFVLYFQYLAEAIQRGMSLDTRQTPNERQAALQQTLPGAPVGALTGRFNAACYGREPSTPAVIADLERALHRLRHSPRSHQSPT
ncbi:MAG: DUF4129 domain-containing protein [Chloroflexi bacterium]|nr:DUF4129 domain-containing protein [Chloroflexota bacterium]